MAHTLVDGRDDIEATGDDRNVDTLTSYLS